MDFTELNPDDVQVDGATSRPEPPPVVKGRVLLADADFFCYQAGYKFEEESLGQSIEALNMMIQTYRIMAGAETIELHTTNGDKASRYDIAKVREYQEDRNNSRDPRLKERVTELRHYMNTLEMPHVVPMPQFEQEADDSITQASYDDRDTVVFSKDKDLWMSVGLYMDTETYEIKESPKGYGECTLDRSGSSTKVRGRGKSFFFHQLLMGDNADTIPGLPAFSAELSIQYFPTKTLLKAQQRQYSAKTRLKAKAARVALDKMYDKVKPKPAGPVTAYEYLKGVRTERQAFQMVRKAYIEHYGPGTFEFKTWRGNVETLTSGDMLLEQARLLWMQRTKGEDVLTYFQEIMA